jgi:hypothetical protein
MQEERNPAIDIGPDDATPNDAGAPEGTPSPFKGVDEDVTSPEERLDEQAKREADD